MLLNDIICRLKNPEQSHLKEQAQRKIDLKTKPPGSLGLMEKLAVQLSIIQNTLEPKIENKLLVVFASDHGVTEEGISAYAPEVTHQMVMNFLSGGAAINVLCRHNHIDLHIADVGVNYDFLKTDKLIHRKIRKGTGNIAREPAMTEEDALKSIETGISVFQALYSEKPYQLTGAGEMGIGNTTSATAIICSACRVPPSEATGRGTGINNNILDHKIKIIEKSLALHKPEHNNGIDILKKVGGYEIGSIAGYMLAAASEGTAIVLDGLIATSGAIIAALIDSRVKGYMIAGHRSVEPGHRTALEFLGLDPVMDTGFRLGEGTGAAVAIPFIEGAAKIMCEMASFDGSLTSKN